MNQPANRLPVISIRFTIITVRRPAVPAARRPALPARARPRQAPLPAGPPIRAGLRHLAVAAVVTAAVILVATVPIWVAQQVIDSRIWDLAHHLVAGTFRPDPSSPVLPLLLGSIVVLAALTSSSRPHDHHHH